VRAQTKGNLRDFGSHLIKFRNQNAHGQRMGTDIHLAVAVLEPG
jgi:hypothetical protein